jgi:hypothetical protein
MEVKSTRATHWTERFPGDSVLLHREPVCAHLLNASSVSRITGTWFTG